MASTTMRTGFGSFRLLDSSLDDTVLCIAAANSGNLSGSETTATAGQPRLGQTGTSFALALAVDDEICISAAWRV